MRPGMMLSWLAELDRGRTLLEQPERAELCKSEQYRRYAQACFEMASEAAEQRIRASLLHMAQVWLGLADADVRRGTNEQDTAG
jgi:hypothetical protein